MITASPAAKASPADKRSLVPEVARQRQVANAVITTSKLGEHTFRVVRAAVVHEQELKMEREHVADGHQLLVELFQAGGLVVSRDDDRDPRFVRHQPTSFPEPTEPIASPGPGGSEKGQARLVIGFSSAEPETTDV